MFTILPLLFGTASAEGLSATQTSYIGANMLEGELDITFGVASPVDPANNPNPLASSYQLLIMCSRIAGSKRM